MDNQGLIFNIVIYLSAAVIAVPVFSRLGLSSVLGYVVAGIIIGPFGLKLISNVQDILHFSEFGVVLMLFLIGLELEPAKLWKMRRSIAGTGGVQVLASALVIGFIASLLGLRWQSAIVAGLALALSSTAIALQVLEEKHLMSTPAGRSGFSILLFQDISVIPIITLIPLLGFELLNGDAAGKEISPLVMVLVIAAILITGRYVLHPVMRFVASTDLREIFTALSLLLVTGISMIMDMIGVSMALGAFLAGVLLADSPYRHTLESDIAPFKGLLLGLFFISVGMSMDFALLFEKPLNIFAITVALMAIKAVILYAIARVNGIPKVQHWFFSFLLCQGGEFGFVLFGFAESVGAIEPKVSAELILAVALSMALTPLLMVFNDLIIQPRQRLQNEPEPEQIDDNENPVLIIGFGRFGQVIGRLLLANHITPTLIDHNPQQLERIRRFGYKPYYGDATRVDVLRSAGADQAKIIVLAMDDEKAVNKAIKLVRSEFPNLRILARAYDRGHAMELIDNDVDGFVRETFHSALELGKEVLVNLGYERSHVESMAETMRRLDLDTLVQQVSVRHDEKAMISISRSARENLEQTLAADSRSDHRHGSTSSDGSDNYTKDS